MIPKVDTTSGVPIYVQLVTQFKRAIAAGVLREGDALPSLRDLAKELRVNPLTIKKAYEELAAAELVTTHHGRGTFVSANTSRFSGKARRDLLKDEIDRLIVEARYLGFAPDELRQRIENGIAAWEANHGQRMGDRD